GGRGAALSGLRHRPRAPAPVRGREDGRRPRLLPPLRHLGRPALGCAGVPGPDEARGHLRLPARPPRPPRLGPPRRPPPPTPPRRGDRPRGGVRRRRPPRPRPGEAPVARPPRRPRRLRPPPPGHWRPRPRPHPRVQRRPRGARRGRPTLP